MRKAGFVLFILMLSNIIIAQENHQQCATVEYGHQLKKMHPSMEKELIAADANLKNWIEKNDHQSSKEVVTIPVVFHVIYNNFLQNIPDQRLLDQLQVLNDDFRKLNADTVNIPNAFKNLAADCEIQFCLARQDPSGNPTLGITRTETVHTSFGISDDNLIKSTGAGGKNIWDRNNYLNIWVVNLTGGLLGYATLPGSVATKDGVVLGYKYVGFQGATPPYNKGRTGTHEVGHWLGLYHIWGDDGGSCNGSDLCNDTPNQADFSQGCPNFPRTDTCTQVAPGVMFMNYMDYVNDNCMHLFTHDQKARMVGTLNTSRVSIKSSPACTPVGVEEVIFSNCIHSRYDNSSKQIIVNICDEVVNNCKVEVYSISGQLIEVIDHNKSTADELFISTQRWDKGMYFLRVTSSNRKITQKMMIY